MHTPPLTQPLGKQPEITGYEIEKAGVMMAMVQWELGTTFLRWLCRLCKWESSVMSTEDAAKRDIWLVMRNYIPPEALGKIETEAAAAQQETFKLLFELEPKEENDDNGTET